MRIRKPNNHELALMSILNCEQKELKRHTPTVYEWRGQFIEVLTREEMLKSKTPASWYTSLPLMDTWRFREMGEDAKIVKKIKKKGSYAQRLSAKNSRKNVVESTNSR